jgi:hypothetical protein
VTGPAPGPSRTPLREASSHNLGHQRALPPQRMFHLTRNLASDNARTLWLGVQLGTQPADASRHPFMPDTGDGVLLLVLRGTATFLSDAGAPCI